MKLPARLWWAWVVLAGCSGSSERATDATTRQDAALRDAGAKDAGRFGPSMDSGMDAAPDAELGMDAAAEAGTPEDAGDAGGMDAAAVVDSECEIGITDPITGLAWEPFSVGQPIPLVGGGQASLLIEIALRVESPPAPADVDVVVTADASGNEERVEIPIAEPGDFDFCGGASCDLVPVYVPTQDLVADPLDLRDLPVTIIATVNAADGSEHCVATLKGKLRREGSDGGA